MTTMMRKRQAITTAITVAIDTGSTLTLRWTSSKDATERTRCGDKKTTTTTKRGRQKKSKR